MSVFKFKQFELKQSEHVFKIGTDAVLLGAWAHPLKNESPLSILDVGCGTGIVSLMLAQRFIKANVCAIDIQQEAYAICAENFLSSPYNQRLEVYHSNLSSFEKKEQFDLIVSNPPYFSHSTLSQNSQKQIARHTLHLNPTVFFSSIAKHSKSNSSICLIIPSLNIRDWFEAAHFFGFTPRKICHVRTRVNSKNIRALILFSLTRGTLIETELVIRNEDNSFSKKYTELTNVFHPFMD